ncbi:PLP-dependent aminotransferase family protein [Streptomyces chumphonensis]|uniref:PLP-dependent aminotransferase family protein n=1 Tax=Streptomyces chumphonensis TaxID=1214925 RepID=A0A927EWY8_9ACTN|nr:PLP-dependent aminotransferase family protein [Streptomyces chumphonensis]MBD3931158.1 PLP-dependent aminotransferase family protein [Streptomyces chumphonensis]
MDRSKDTPGQGAEPGTADFLQLDAGEAPPGGLADWLAARLRQAVRDGRLPVGGRLPPTRVLAGELRVSRGVVTEAYRRLVEDGHAAGRGRNGTVIVAAPVGVPGPATTADPRPAPLPRPPSPHALFAGPPGPEVFETLRSVPVRIDLSPGRPDLAAFPRAAWLRAERALLGGLAAPELGYGDPHGAPRFRRAVADWLARNRGVRAEPEEIVVVGGVAQALALLARVLRARGTAEVAVEDPGSLGVRQQLSGWGIATPPVPVDADGLRVDALRRSGARAVLVTPAHQFPTGVVLSGHRRGQLVEWAADGGLVVEDDYDAEHRYGRPPVAALRSLLPDHVCYTGSVSKLLAPALRVGWLLVPRHLHDDVVAAKRLTDLGNALLPQLVLARLMESGDLERHLRALRRRHRRRRDVMIEALAAHLPGAVVHGTAAGLHLLVTFDGRVRDTDVAAEALVRSVKAQPLAWHAIRPTGPGLVLGYAACTATEIREGVAVLAGVVRDLNRAGT